MKKASEVQSYFATKKLVTLTTVYKIYRETKMNENGTKCEGLFFFILKRREAVMTACRCDHDSCAEDETLSVYDHHEYHGRVAHPN